MTAAEYLEVHDFSHDVQQLQREVGGLQGTLYEPSKDVEERGHAVRGVVPAFDFCVHGAQDVPHGLRDS